MRKETSCGSIIINDGKILVIKQISGFYGFPKGHMEPGETEVETATRETKEETNVDVKVLEEYRYPISYIKEEKGEKFIKEVNYYLAKLNGKIDAKGQETEVADVIWVDIDKVYDTLTFDNLKELWLKAYKDIKDNNIK